MPERPVPITISSLRRMIEHSRIIHLRRTSAPPSSRSDIEKKTVLKEDQTTSSTTQLVRHSNKKWKSTGSTLKTKSSLTKGEKRRPSRWWKTGEMPGEGWSQKLQGRRSISMSLLTLQKLEGGREPTGNRRITSLDKRPQKNFWCSHPLMRKLHLTEDKRCLQASQSSK